MIRIVISVCALAIMAGAARAGHHADPAGFSITYPDGWTAVTPAMLSDLVGHAPPQLVTWMKENDFKLGRSSLSLLSETAHIDSANLSVMAVHGGFVASQAAATRHAQSLTDEIPKLGIKIGGIRSDVRRIGSHNAVVVECWLQPPFDGPSMWQRQIVLGSEKSTFVVTCGAKLQEFDKHSMAFEAMLASFTITERPARGAVKLQASSPAPVVNTPVSREQRLAGGEWPVKMIVTVVAFAAIGACAEIMRKKTPPTDGDAKTKNSGDAPAE